MPQHEYTVLVRKMTERKQDNRKAASQVTTIAKKAVSGDRERRGWSFDIKHYDDRRGTKFHIYEYQIVLTFKGEATRESTDKEVDTILLPLMDKAGQAIKPAWTIEALNGAAWVRAEKMLADGKVVKPYAHVEIPKNYSPFFKHIYDRDSQIDVALAYIQAGIDSAWLYRPHCAFVGEPGGGKTETARAIRQMLGEEAVFEMDATATTMAGAIKNLKERTVMPRICIIEEIEKADFDQFPWLLAVMDPRGEIRKVTYREETILDTQMLVIGMINNFKAFKHALEGALSSRFGEPIFFPKADRKTQRRILERDVLRIQGDVAWIDPAIDYAQEAGIYDIRHILAICMAGKGRLNATDKTAFQNSLRKCRIPDDYLAKMGMEREIIEEDKKKVVVSGGEKKKPARKPVSAKV